MMESIYKRGTTTAIASVEVYAWYDWDGNGAVNMALYPAGEIEQLVSSATGVVSTSVSYPIGRDVLYQCHVATYESETFARNRAELPPAHAGAALSVPNVYMTLTDTGVTRININGELIATGTPDYNYTLSGSTPDVMFRHTSTSTDSGINEKAYTHWGTGLSYGGTFIGATFTNQDWIDLDCNGYDGVFIGATTTYVWWFTDGYFNDASTTSDDIFTLTFCNMDIDAAGDIATIGLYNTCETEDIESGDWTTVIGTSETGLDIVA